MSDALDGMLEELRRAPTAALPGLEGEVWSRIDSLRDVRRSSGALLPLRGACVVAALGIGLAGGSYAAMAAARRPAEISVFSVDAHLAPSTLLTGR
ncbi:hypothetical protein ASD89_10080 [Caulobacter sp. Root656]|nr:hypothetical protein ASD89_10080 [Caulobacter sp. Root656]